MLTSCLMLSVTHYAQNYAGIMGGSLARCLVKSMVYETLGLVSFGNNNFVMFSPIKIIG